jgi:predicted P-loop ATPase/GTPase
MAIARGGELGEILLLLTSPARAALYKIDQAARAISLFALVGTPTRVAAECATKFLGPVIQEI